MSRFTKKVSKKIGLPPGSIVHFGKTREESVNIKIVEYGPQGVLERDARSIEDCFPLKEAPAVTWIDIDGIHQIDIVKKIGARLNLHPLFLEDIVTTGQYPKVEYYGDYLFIVLKMLDYERGGQIAVEQVSLVLGPNYVITFQEKVSDIFKPLREMIQGNHRFCSNGADYLAYALMDFIVDHYFPILEKLGDDIEDKGKRIDHQSRDRDHQRDSGSEKRAALPPEVGLAPA